MFWNEGKVRFLKREYPQGTKVRLVEMTEESCERMYKGLEGTVEFVDDAGHIHVRWDNGSSLSLLPDVDKFEKIEG